MLCNIPAIIEGNSEVDPTTGKEMKSQDETEEGKEGQLGVLDSESVLHIMSVQ